MSEGGTVTVSPSTGAVSAEGVAKYNEELKKYINNLAQQSFQAGFASSFGKDSDKDSSQSEFAKLFDTISNKVINRIGNVNSNILELKKQNSEQSVKLLNLTTSMYSTMSSQKDTIDELYKIIDTKLGQLIGKLDKNSEPTKTNTAENSPIRAQGIIRGIGGLNKQLVEIHKIIAAKIVPMMNTIIEKIGAQSQAARVEAVTPKADAIVEKDEIVKQPATNTAIVKKDESRTHTLSRLETAGVGFGQILGGASLMGIGGIIESMKKSIDELPAKLLARGKETVSKTEIPFAQGATLGDLGEQLSKFGDKSFFKRDLAQDAQNLMEPLFGAIKENIATRIGKDQEWLTSLFEKYDEEMKPFNSAVKSVTDGIDAVIEQVTGWAEYFGKSDKVNKNPEDKNLDGTPSQRLPKMDQAYVQKVNSKPEPLRGIHALDLYKKQPLGEYSIVNNATNPLPSITGNIVSNPISPMTQAIQQSSSEIELAKQNSLNNTIKQSHAIILNNNQQSAPQQPTIINPPTPRNTDSTKAFLDKMVLMGGYTGSGILLN
jgi:hypothetical protein